MCPSLNSNAFQKKFENRPSGSDFRGFTEQARAPRAMRYGKGVKKLVKSEPLGRFSKFFF